MDTFRDIKIGDTVQIMYGDRAGRVGIVIGVKLSQKVPDQFAYTIKMSDRQSVIEGGALKVIRPAEDENNNHS